MRPGGAFVPLNVSNAALAMNGSIASPKVVYLGGSLSLRLNTFTELEARYENSIFETAQWQTLRSQRNLYRQTRALFNPTRRLVDTYAAMVYPGALATSKEDLPDGVPLAMPVAPSTPARLQRAISQLWQWSNFQSLKAMLVRYGGIFGTVAVEVIDVQASQKVRFDVWRPDYVSDVLLNAVGDVKAIRFAYMARDNQGMYLYEKEITPTLYATYRNGFLYDYLGQGRATWPNPYGYVPVVWCKHRNVGGVWGAPAIDGSINKIDQMNSLASQMLDAASKKVAAPFMIFSATPPSQIGGKRKRGPTSDGNPSGNARVKPGDEASMSADAGDRETLPYWWAGGVDGHVEGIGPTITLTDAMPVLESMLKEVEEDHPELTLWRQLRAMSTVTGPAAERLVGDAANRILETGSDYDVQMVKLHQMAIGIGGWRANGNGWVGGSDGLTEQQRAFLPFGLDSYARGDTDFSILPRPILPKTSQENMTELLTKGQAIQAFTGAGYTLESVLKEEFHYKDDVVGRILSSQNDALYADTVPPPLPEGAVQ